jgi:thiosulfate dehydrogenase
VGRCRARRRGGGRGSAAPAEKAPAAEAGSAAQNGNIYGAFGERDQKIWQAATDEFVTEGKRIFHDAKALGGTIAVSCDMCHPDAANTHPETYPKFQVQFGRVALLRDVINWCIENPVRGKPLHDDDPRLKELEAYILAQRRGVPLEYGKH